jgi:hypothetical protein
LDGLRESRLIVRPKVGALSKIDFCGAGDACKVLLETIKWSDAVIGGIEEDIVPELE